MIDLLPGEWARFGYLALLLVFLGSALIFEFAGRRNQAMRQAAVWALIFGVAVAAAGWWQGSQGSQKVLDEGRRIELPLGPDGHFHMLATVNGAPIRFVIDTGASEVVLSREDAAKAGINPDDLAYIGAAQTANGRVETAPVRLEKFEIGGIIDEDVRASVNGGVMDGSLLGMSYLRRFARVSFEGDLMVLER